MSGAEAEGDSVRVSPRDSEASERAQSPLEVAQQHQQSENAPRKDPIVTFWGITAPYSRLIMYHAIFFTVLLIPGIVLAALSTAIGPWGGIIVVGCVLGFAAVTGLQMRTYVPSSRTPATRRYRYTV